MQHISSRIPIPEHLEWVEALRAPEISIVREALGVSEQSSDQVMGLYLVTEEIPTTSKRRPLRLLTAKISPYDEIFAYDTASTMGIMPEEAGAIFMYPSIPKMIGVDLMVRRVLAEDLPNYDENEEHQNIMSQDVPEKPNNRIELLCGIGELGPDFGKMPRIWKAMEDSRAILIVSNTTGFLV